jgi:PAS domain S-box-containing protein
MERLRESEAQSRLLASIVESSNDAIISKLPDGTVLSWNDGATRLYGYTAEEMIGKPVSMVVPPDRQEEWQELMERAKRGECVSNVETVRIRKDGSRVDVAFKLSPVKDERGEIVALSAIVSDITDQKRAQEELRDSREHLRALAAHLQMVREEERTRISREIHDELGQMLTGLKMDLRWVENRLARPLPIGEQQAIQEKIVEAETMTDSTIEAIQRIAAELRPSVLDNFGLSAALGFEARRFEQRAGIQVRISAPQDLTAVEKDAATALFRIYQETLTNVARHAGATKVEVRLYDRGRELVLEVEDNGKGISDDAASKRASLGLLGMSERVGLLGGHISFRGTRDKGTTVIARIPRVAPGGTARHE